MHGALVRCLPLWLADCRCDSCSLVLFLQVLKVLKEAHEWLCKENEAEVRKNLESRGWLSAFDLQPDVPFPERK